MNKRERARVERQAEKRNEEIRAEHAKIRTQIVALQPSWSIAKLEVVTATWGDGALFDILNTCKKMADFAAKYGTDT